MSDNELSQGGKMADLASKAALNLVQVEHTARALGLSTEAVQINREMIADMSAKAADQLRAEGR